MKSLLPLSLALSLALLSACTTPASLTAWPRWTTLHTGTDASLRGVSVAPDGTVWVSGSGGTVLRSETRGAAWRSVGPNDAQADLRDVEALDGRRALALRITEPARVLGTEDGGLSWQVLLESPYSKSFLDSIALLEGGGVLVFGDPQRGAFEVWRSEDGRRFEPVAPEHLPPPAEGEAAFAASGTCVVAHGTDHAWIATGGQAARVLRSTDGGRTWSASPTPVRQGEATTGIYSVGFDSRHRGVVVGGDYTAPEQGGEVAAFTQDGGRTWRAAFRGPAGYRSAVAPVPGYGGLWFAVGRAGASLSRDSGRTWEELPLPEGEGAGYYALAFGLDGTGYAVGAEGRVARIDWGGELEVAR